MGVFALAANSTGLALVEFALVLSGLGLGVASPSLSSTVSNEFAPEDLGTAAASQQLMNQLGTVAGIQVMETVRAAALRGHHGPDAQLHAFHLAYLVGGAVALLGVVAAAMSRSTERTERNVAPTVEALEALDVTERQPVVMPSGDGLRPGPTPRSALTGVAQTVISRSRLATSWAFSSAGAPWSIMSLAMSPSTLTLPAMKACMPTWGLPSTRIALAVA